MTNRTLQNTDPGVEITSTDLFFTTQGPGPGVHVTAAQLGEFALDFVGASIVGGANIGVLFDDATDTISISYTGVLPPATTGDLIEGPNLYFTVERAQDAVASLLVAGTGINLTHDDANNSLTIETDQIVPR